MTVHTITAGDMPWQHVHALSEPVYAALAHATDMDGALGLTLLLEACARAGVLPAVMEALSTVTTEYEAAAM
jgi:hypothetical protein